MFLLDGEVDVSVSMVLQALVDILTLYLQPRTTIRDTIRELIKASQQDLYYWR